MEELTPPRRRQNDRYVEGVIWKKGTYDDQERRAVIDAIDRWCDQDAIRARWDREEARNKLMWAKEHNLCPWSEITEFSGLQNRTTISIRSFATSQLLPNQAPWTREELSTFRDLRNTLKPREIAMKLQRSPDQVFKKLKSKSALAGLDDDEPNYDDAPAACEPESQFPLNQTPLVPRKLLMSSLLLLCGAVITLLLRVSSNDYSRRLSSMVESVQSTGSCLAEGYNPSKDQALTPVDSSSHALDQKLRVSGTSQYTCFWMCFPQYAHDSYPGREDTSEIATGHASQVSLPVMQELPKVATTDVVDAAADLSGGMLVVAKQGF